MYLKSQRRFDRLVLVCALCPSCVTHITIMFWTIFCLNNVEIRRANLESRLSTLRHYASLLQRSNKCVCSKRYSVTVTLYEGKYWPSVHEVFIGRSLRGTINCRMTWTVAEIWSETWFSIETTIQGLFLNVTGFPKYL